MRDGSLAGYGVLRPCRAGAKVGPLFADDAQAATALLARAARGGRRRHARSSSTSPPRTRRASALREGRAMEPCFETARMYRGGAIPEDLTRVFGVTTLELG